MIAVSLSIPIGVLGQAKAYDKGNGAASGNAETDNYQRGSDTLPVTVKIQGAETAQERAANHAEDVSRHNSDQRWMIGIGVATIIAAFAAVGAAIWLVIVTSRLHRATRDLAVSTEDLAKGAARQVAMAGKQIEVSERQQGVARLQYLATHPPKVILRDVFFSESITGEVVTKDRFVTFLLINEGATDATIKESFILLEWQFGARKVRNMVSAGHSDLGQIIMKGGEPRYFEWPVPDDMSLYELFGSDRVFVDQIHAKFGELHFAGCLLYDDFDGNPRRSVFRRVYNWARGGFYRTDDPDDEYAN